MREGHRRSGMTEPDCTVMFNFLYIHKQTHTYAHTISGLWQGLLLADISQLHLQGPASTHAYYTERVIESEGREGANWAGGRIGDGNGGEGRNGNANGDGDGGGDGAGTRTGSRGERT